MECSVCKSKKEMLPIQYTEQSALCPKHALMKTLPDLVYCPECGVVFYKPTLQKNDEQSE